MAATGLRSSMDDPEAANIKQHKFFRAKKLTIFVAIAVFTIYVCGTSIVRHFESRVRFRHPKVCKFPCNPPASLAATGATGMEKGWGDAASDQLNFTRMNCSQKIILAWTTVFSVPFENNLSNRHLGNCTCGSSCHISSDKALIREAALVLFHARDVDFSSLPTFRTATQLWIIFNSESPVYAGINERYEGMFNLTMMYRRDSDLYMPYGRYKPSRTGARISPESLEGSVRRKPVYWLVNNCVQRRMDYALELAKHIEVDIIGGCSGRRTCPNGNSCERTLLSSYAFYLSFENSYCPDYISEKLWKVLKSPGGAIPIVMGASLSDYNAVAPPESFIHVDNFTSPQELATFLKKVMSNSVSFAYYHRWRESYAITEDDEEFTACLLCDAAQRGAQTSEKAVKVSKWFNEGCH